MWGLTALGRARRGGAGCWPSADRRSFARSACGCAACLHRILHCPVGERPLQNQKVRYEHSLLQERDVAVARTAGRPPPQLRPQRLLLRRLPWVLPQRLVHENSSHRPEVQHRFLQGGNDIEFEQVVGERCSEAKGNFEHPWLRAHSASSTSMLRVAG